MGGTVRYRTGRARDGVRAPRKTILAGDVFAHAAMFLIPAIAAILAVVLFAASRTVKNDVARLRNWMTSAADA